MKSQLNRSVRVCIVQPAIGAVSETFIRAHAELLPAEVTVVYGFPPQIENHPLTGTGLLARAARRLERTFFGGLRPQSARLFARTFRKVRPDVVLAEYGPSGVHVMDACRNLGLPLVVHFHGFDASIRGVLEWQRDNYRDLFKSATSVIAVSHAMRERLVELGANPKGLHHITYGVDCEQFGGANPANAPPVFLACGRFVEKKAPQLTLRAFAEVARRHPEARLRMIGDGPMFELCQKVAQSLQIGERVEFLGARPHNEVQEQMRRVRAFVQHSVVADDGDSEGTPLGVLEAGASGLPVVATRHAGIPDVVIDGETGLLVDERDVGGMANCMERMIREPNLAGTLGRKARDHVRANYSQAASIEKLWQVLKSATETSAQGLPLD